MENPNPTAAVTELHIRLKQARRHTPFGRLFPEDRDPIYRAVARDHHCTVEDLHHWTEGGAA
ncbi:hypothetical protein [Paenirhodobacter populi]|uniref:Transcriptional regulator n=1 Tax=Paenirhodobacter populi TaxID=2306993 RepID=A0A443JE79_9RHOB|nr:hypothetical protein [Sinirhodobacter populi]RWR18822.1 hypothetical protein D2T30_15805 [Sinirhodobacter populi]